MYPLLWVVIVSRNTRDLLAQRLESLYQDLPGTGGFL